MNFRFLSALLAVLCMSSPLQADALKIGVLLCQTGGCAEWGNAGIQGAKLAIEEINAAGGVRGMPVELFVEDSAEDNLGATISAYRSLRSRDVGYIVGPTWSPAGNALSPIAKKDPGVVMISPSLGVRDFNEAGENLFNIWPHDEYNARRLASFALEEGLRTIAIMSAQQPWSVMQTKAFREEFEARGGTIVTEESPLPESHDLRIEAARVARSGADAVLFTCFAEQMGVASAQLKKLGFTGKQLSVLMYDSAIETAHGALEGTIYAAHPPAAREFQKKFTERYGVSPGTSADKAYDAVKIIAAAASAAQGSEVTKVRDALAATNHFPGASGEITFTAVRGVRGTPELYQVQSGRMGLAYDRDAPSMRAQLKRE